MVTGVADLATVDRDRIARLDTLLDTLHDGQGAGLTPTEAAVRTVTLRYQRANLSGRDTDLRAAQDAAEEALRQGLVSDNLLTALARIHLDNHDLKTTTELLDRCRYGAASATVQGMRAAVLLQQGDAVAAARLLRTLLTDEPSWEHLAGLAAVHDELDDLRAAEKLYQSAAHELDAKQLSALAWVEVRRARLARRAGDSAGARAYLRRAQDAWFDWRVAAESARYRLEEGDLSGAAALAEALVSHTGRPDHEHLLADVHAAMGDRTSAARHRDAALRGYAAAGRRWPWRYLHHQAELQLTAGTPADLGEALRLAEDDHRARPHRTTGRLLVTVLTACGHTARANRLAAELEEERRRALAALDGY
ncbi:tetratricopeptide repeat protein [Streptomyces sp. NPDC053542]|uniref:tetratricopeptide repeat protein n=1 Tax=Streptomyces sp. NPDC053542 TaxID=3365710 RepID=UPI0037D317F4